jgi:hypothetical protein
MARPHSVEKHQSLLQALQQIAPHVNRLLIYIYLIVILGVSLVSLLVVWPSTPNEFGTPGQRLSAEMRQLLLVAAGAILGSSLTGLRGLVGESVETGATRRSLWGYALDVLLAVPMSLSLYVAMRGLILSPAAGVEDLNASGVLVLFIFVGMYGPEWLFRVVGHLRAARDARMEDGIARISTALGVATLDNYRGYVCVALRYSSGTAIRASDDGRYVLTTPGTCSLTAWFAPVEQDDVQSQRIEISGGTDASKITFSLSADTDVGKIDRRNASLTFGVAQPSEQATFTLTDLPQEGSGRVFVEILQKNRLIEVVSMEMTIGKPPPQRQL